MSDTANESGQRPTVMQRIFSSGVQGAMQTGALFLIVAACFAFIYGIANLIFGKDSKAAVTNAGFDFWRDVFSPNFNTIAIVTIGLVCALLGIRLFSKAGSLTSQVIRAEDRILLEPLISQANKEAIGEYIRLASLSGFVGTFTKLGFTGLPLVTVALTLILLCIALFIKDAEMQKSVFDMAKLMLGAFIGSFVQRNIEQEKLVAGIGGVSGGGADKASDDKTAAEKAAAGPPSSSMG